MVAGAGFNGGAQLDDRKVGVFSISQAQKNQLDGWFLLSLLNDVLIMVAGAGFNGGAQLDDRKVGVLSESQAQKTGTKNRHKKTSSMAGFFYHY